jgi:hypothetical protein
MKDHVGSAPSEKLSEKWVGGRVMYRGSAAFPSHGLLGFSRVKSSCLSLDLFLCGPQNFCACCIQYLFMASEDFGVIRFLHDAPELVEPTVALLNAEWPRKGSYWFVFPL